MEKEQLNEERYRKSVIVMRIIGGVMMIGGISLAVLGVVVFRSPFGMSTIPNPAMLVSGIFMAMLGLFVLSASFLRKMIAFQAQGVRPVASEIFTHTSEHQGWSNIASQFRGMTPAEQKKCVETELKKAKDLRNKNLISEDEYQSMRKKILELN